MSCTPLARMVPQPCGLFTARPEGVSGLGASAGEVDSTQFDVVADQMLLQFLERDIARLGHQEEYEDQLQQHHDGEEGEHRATAEGTQYPGPG